MFSKTLSAVLREPWLIDQEWAKAHLPIVLQMMKGENVSFKAATPTDSSVIGQYDPDYRACVLEVSAGGVVKASRYRSFRDAPEGSIAVIPVSGPITKFTGDCGEPGTEIMGQWVREADAAHNISGIVVKIDSPGGMVSGTQSFVDTLSNTRKRTIGYVDDGLMASAAMWIGAACDQVYASQKTDLIGSIGVLTTIADFTAMFEKEGIKLVDIYASQSTEKNLDYRNALNGDYRMIQSRLDFIAKEFISSIQSLRKGKLNLAAGDPFKGAIYNAVEATKIGLIDGIKSFEEVLVITANGNSSTSKSTSKSSSMFGMEKFTTISGRIGHDSHTDEDIAGINLQLEEKGVLGLILVRTSELEAVANAAQVSEKLTARVAELNDTIAQISSESAEKTTQITQLNEQVTSLNTELDGAGAKRTGVKKEMDDEAASSFKINSEAPHNKRARIATSGSSAK